MEHLHTLRQEGERGYLLKGEKLSCLTYNHFDSLYQNRLLMLHHVASMINHLGYLCCLFQISTKA